MFDDMFDDMWIQMWCKWGIMSLAVSHSFTASF